MVLIMNNILPVIFTKGEIPVIGQRVTGPVFNDDRYINGTEICTSTVKNLIVMNDEPNRYSAMIVTQSGTKYMVYTKAPAAYKI